MALEVLGAVQKNFDDRVKQMNDESTSAPRMPKWEELQARVSKPLIRPKVIVRPLQPRVKNAEYDTGSNSPLMIRSVMVSVFQYLPINDLLCAMRVCKTWAEFSVDPSLWKVIRLNHLKMKTVHLMGVTRRQPDVLDLSWTKVNIDQMAWLLVRLPQLRELSISGHSLEVVLCLCSSYCPPLRLLDISFSEDITDKVLNNLLSPPRSIHNYHANLKTRLWQLTDLKMAGTRIGDDGILTLTKCLHNLKSLDLSSCFLLTELSVALLSHPSTPLSQTLLSLDFRGCHRLSRASLTYFEFFTSLGTLRLHPCKLIPLRVIQMWAKTNGFVLDKEKILRRVDGQSP